MTTEEIFQSVKRALSAESGYTGDIRMDTRLSDLGDHMDHLIAIDSLQETYGVPEHSSDPDLEYCQTVGDLVAYFERKRRK